LGASFRAARLAVAADCDFIVTYNQKDFRGVERFGLQIITPKEFLKNGKRIEMGKMWKKD